MNRKVIGWGIIVVGVFNMLNGFNKTALNVPNATGYIIFGMIVIGLGIWLLNMKTKTPPSDIP